MYFNVVVVITQCKVLCYIIFYMQQVEYKLKEQLEDHPFWRTQETKKDVPSISQMIEDILDCKKIWDDFKITVENAENQQIISKQLKDISIDFFVSIQVEEV